jgi:hypothetical protein
MILIFAVLVPSVRRWRNVPEYSAIFTDHGARKKKKHEFGGRKGSRTPDYDYRVKRKIIMDLSAFSVVR